MPKLEEGLNENTFQVDGNPYQRGRYNIVLSTDGESFGIREIGGNAFVSDIQRFDNYTDATDTAFASKELLRQFFQQNIYLGG